MRVFYPVFMEKIQSRNTTIYRISPIRLYFLPAFFGVFAALFFGLAIFGGRDVLPIGLVLGGMMALFAFGGYLLVAYARLEISPEGVAVRHTGFRLATSWDNIAELMLANTAGGVLGFVLRQPLTGANAAAEKRLYVSANLGPGGTQFYDDTRMDLIQERRFIPCEAFAYWFARPALQSELERYAPHLRAQLAPAIHQG